LEELLLKAMEMLCLLDLIAVSTKQKQPNIKANQVVSDNLGPVDFAVRLADSVLYLPKGQG